MAKRKKHHAKRKPTRRRRMSGISSHGMTSDLMEVVGLVVGSVAATVAQRQLTSMNPKIVAAGELVGGYMLKKHAHSPLMNGISYGLMTAGAIGIAHDFGVIHGVEDFVSGMMDGDSQGYIESEHDMAGLGNEAMMSGLGNEAMVSGGWNDELIDQM